MGRGQSELIESNLLLGTELHEALRPRSGQQLQADRARTREIVQSMREFDRVAPGQLVELKDWLLAMLPVDEAGAWRKRVLNAAPTDADYEGLADRLAVRRLQEECLPLAGNWPQETRAQVTEAVNDVINVLEGRGDRTEAQRKAARAASASTKVVGAKKMVRSAEAAWSAVWSGEGTPAVWSAKAVVDLDSADSIRREAERFIDELEKLPPV